MLAFTKLVVSQPLHPPHEGRFSGLEVKSERSLDPARQPTYKQAARTTNPTINVCQSII
ncbi:MAG TPA: hypothetical protein VK208_09390 [Pyrinomonadaceae bacterium]|jgi:hypothetical protein|nr:hypothetical protein [Pyrinomonadaceae bacterium]